MRKKPSELHFQKSYISVREKNLTLNFQKVQFPKEKNPRVTLIFKMLHFSEKKQVLHFHKKLILKKLELHFQTQT